jgi:hypothetical protein
LTVKPANAQGGQTPNYSDYIPTPAIPQFTLRFVQSSYNEIVTDPYTGVNTTQQVNNSTIEIIIRNQPFTSYNYGWQYKNEVVNRSTSLWYNVQAKGHYSKGWTEIYLNNTVTYYPSQINTQSNSSDYTTISLLESETNYPAGGQVDFRVRAMAGGFFPPVLYSMINLPLNFISKNSSWSPTQTITIPASSVSPNPTSTPAVPELSWSIVVPLLLSVFSVALMLRHRKTSNLRYLDTAL